MSKDQGKLSSGLEDVVAARTRLSSVDGADGQLIIAGHRVEELGVDFGFEAVCRLLWEGERPDDEKRRELQKRVGRKRLEVFDRLADSRIASMGHPMEALRSAMASFETGDDPFEDAVTALAVSPVAAAAWWSRRGDRQTVRPNPEANTARDYLRMVTGESPTEAEVAALERYLVTVSDHGLNASTFTARVIASTRSDLISAVTGAIGALKGPLHGGAPGPVLDMLDAIEESGDAEAWIRNELDEGRRIMGMGHRVYRVRDPRAAVFEEALGLLEQQEDSERLALARRVERVAARVLAERYPERKLEANVEFYTAVLLEAVGIPRRLFTPTFAVGRMAGWTAHVLEQRGEDRLIRPRSEYVGPQPPANSAPSSFAR